MSKVVRFAFDNPSLAGEEAVVNTLKKSQGRDSQLREKAAFRQWPETAALINGEAFINELTKAAFTGKMKMQG
jgi:hypothetical protein